MCLSSKSLAFKLSNNLLFIDSLKLCHLLLQRPVETAYLVPGEISMLCY